MKKVDRNYITYMEGEKLINVLEHFLSFHEADEIWTMIFDPKCNVQDCLDMLDNYNDDNYINPNE